MTHEYHIIDPKYYVIDCMEENCTSDNIRSICGLPEGFVTDVIGWRLQCVGHVMEDLEEIPEDARCDICFRDLEGLKLSYLSKI